MNHQKSAVSKKDSWTHVLIDHTDIVCQTMESASLFTVLGCQTKAQLVSKPNQR